ncbi:tyrosine-type recombinase/integrase [Geomicrobium sp. JSM 1781026]|uniref:tyrosine-type recombinase/integrase n=1 Tax=Geomicrobium sp. JSM 1781026 TaxID=3344580 RepID=UPI0035BF3C29
MHPNECSLPKPANKYLDALAAKGRKTSTIKRYRYDLLDYYSYVHEHVQPDEQLPTYESLSTFFTEIIEKRNYKYKTYKRIHTVLLRYGAYLCEMRWQSVNPVEDITLPESDEDELSVEDLFSHREVDQLLRSIHSDNGLSETQQKSRPLLAPRNLIMIRLLLFYGLRLQELYGLQIDDWQRPGRLHVKPLDGEVLPRTISLSQADRTYLRDYLDVIPTPVQPVLGSEHPLFISFDYQRQTYRWSYEEDMPKRLTIVAMQKMIREELKRAGLPLGRSAQHMRHTFIVRSLENDEPLSSLQQKLGLHSPLVLQRYEQLALKDES